MMSNQQETHNRLHKPWVNIARVAWIVIVISVMVLYTAGLLIGLGALREVCTGVTCHPNSLNPEQASFNQQIGLSLDFYAWYTTLVLGLFGFVFFAIAWLIFLRRSDDWMALFVSLWMVLFGAGINGVIPGPGTILFIFANAGLFILMCLFPDGKFVPRWTRWLVILWILFTIGTMFTSPPPAQGISSGPPSPIIVLVFLTGIAVQIYRYRRVSTPLQKQQTKWAVSGFVVWFGSLALLLLALNLFPILSEPGLPDFVLDRYLFAIVGLFPLLFFPVGISISILRYRLWDIDIIIRRTLVYGSLTATLLVLYFVLVLGLQSLVTAVGGQQSAITIVISTLVIAAIFNPLRRRIQRDIDRSFYRRRYDAEETLAGFSIILREEVDLENLSLALLNVVDDTMQPESVSVWLKERSE